MRASFVFSEVFTGLRRNITMTIAMILTTAISLVMFGAGLMMVKAVDLTKDKYVGDLEVAIYLTMDASNGLETCNRQPCEGLQQAIEQHPAVDTFVFVNQADALERFKKLFADQPELLAAGTAENLPASIQVKLKDPERSAAIVQEFQGKEGVYTVHDGGKEVDRLVDGLNDFRTVAFIGSLVLLAAAVMLIANMVQISAFTRRTEVSIMRLVGATRWYTQLPFLLEAMFAGLLGAIVAIVGLVTLPRLVSSELTDQIGKLVGFPDTLYTAFVISPVLLAVSMVISAIVGYVTLRLYVRN